MVVFLFIFQKNVRQRLQGCFLTWREFAIVAQQGRFHVVQLIGMRWLGFLADVGMPDKIVNRDLKEICQPNHGADIRFNTMIFIFIDRLLADADLFSQMLLGDTGFGTKSFQIFEQTNHLRLNRNNCQ